MKKIFLCILLIFFSINANASQKENIVKKLEETKNLVFNFEQNINGKIENGKCTIKYPKKIYCKYNTNNKKILVSNGKSIVIKTNSSFYIYPIEKTALNLLLDKEYIINKIEKLSSRNIENKFINFYFVQNETKINLFFDKNTFNLIGWQTLDIYQNLSITHLNSISKNVKLEKNLFKLPKQD
tara:strand:+ start:26 stop:574 length:549 start_codon:yes stop_codon:yes gene_type:complete